MTIKTHLLQALAKRLIAAVLVIITTATITFFVQAAAPGDRATLLLNLASGESRERLPVEIAPVNAQYGFNDPLLIQYWHYLKNLCRGDLGISYQLQEPVSSIISSQIGSTLLLTIGALLVAWILLVFTILTTGGRPGLIGKVGSTVDTIAAALPPYWLGAILMVVFAVNLGWFPVESGSNLRGMVLPVITLAVPLAGFLASVTREEFNRALTQPFVITAFARGATANRVRLRHILRHSIIPALSISGWAMGALFGGAVIVETLFAREGIGQTLVTAAIARDLPLVNGIVVVIAAVYVIANLVVDFLYRVTNPQMSNS